MKRVFSAGLKTLCIHQVHDDERSIHHFQHGLPGLWIFCKVSTDTRFKNYANLGPFLRKRIKNANPSAALTVRQKVPESDLLLKWIFKVVRIFLCYFSIKNNNINNSNIKFNDLSISLTYLQVHELKRQNWRPKERSFF